MRELIKTARFEAPGGRYYLRLYDLGLTDSLGKAMLGYSLSHKSRIIFEGNDFACSPLHPIDSFETACALLGFLTLRPGDTDQEYFDRYTKEQLEWANSTDCENLSAYVASLEE